MHSLFVLECGPTVSSTCLDFPKMMAYILDVSYNKPFLPQAALCQGASSEQWEGDRDRCCACLLLAH